MTAINRCENSKNLPISINLYLSKKSLSVTEIKGNLTFDKPFTDSLIVSDVKIIFVFELCLQ